MTAEPRRIGRVTAVAGAAVTAALLTAGCAAGQVAQTADQKSSIDGTNAQVGTMDLRTIAIVAPPSQQTTYRPGSSAQFYGVFVNNARTADRLVDVRTSVAKGWAAYASAADAFNVVLATNAKAEGKSSPSASASASPSGSSSPSDSSSSGSSSSGSSSTGSSSTGSSSTGSSSTGSSSSGSSSSAAALPTGIQSVTIPAGGRVGFSTPEAVGGLLLSNLTRTLRPAQTVNVSFTFARAGTVTIPVTVQVADLGRTASVADNGQGGEG